MPADAEQADLEIGYNMRGTQVADCDARRQLAVDTAAQEHTLEDEWRALREYRNLPWWRRIFTKAPE